MEETKNLTPAIDALSLALEQYIHGINVKSLSDDQTPIFSMLTSDLSILKNLLGDSVEFVEFCAKLISDATDADKLLKSSLVDNIRKILVDNAPKEYFKVRMLKAFDIYESKQHRKLNDDSIALAKQMIKIKGASDLYDELYKFIKTFEISNEEEGLLKILYKVNQEYLAQPAPDVLSFVGSTLSSTVSSLVDKLPTFPRSRPTTPVKGMEIDDNKPDSIKRLAPIITDETVYRVRRSNKKTHSKKVEIAPPTEEQLQKERDEAELARRQADAERAAQLAIQKAMDEAKRIEQEKQEESQRREEAEKEAQAKIQEEIARKERENEAAKAAAKAAEIARQQAEKAKRQEEIERQEKERQAAREAELAQQRAIEAKRQEEIEHQEREKQAAIDAELVRQREIEARKQEESERQAKEIQDREDQAKQREQELETKKLRLVAAKNEKENIPQQIGAWSNLIQDAQEGYSLATAQFIKQRRRENFWPWQRTAVKSLESEYVKDPEGQQKKLDAIIHRGLYSFEIFRTSLFFSTFFNLRKERFERHFQDCRKASYVEAQLDLLAKGDVLNKGAFGAFVDESLADAFDNTYKNIEHKSNSIKGYQQKLYELTQEIIRLEAELLPARMNVQQSSDGALLRSRSPSLSKI